MKKFENIILASDIDGTFIFYGAPFPTVNLEKIKYFIENGGHFTFSSGRNHIDIYSVIPSIEEYVNTPCVLCNGTFCYDIVTHEIKNAHYLESEHLIPLFRRVRELAGDKIGFRVSCRRGFLYDKNDIAMKESLEKNGQTQFATAIDFDELCGNDYFKAVFVSEPQILSDTFDIIKKEFPMYDYTRSYIWLTELMPKGISKATQLKFIMSEARKTNPNAKLYCVGDFDNDADMLRVADVAMCPENATDEIKKLCSVRLCHAKDGAIADAIEKIEAGL